jgi:O-antigen/teichoic acid export membrane protein
MINYTRKAVRSSVIVVAMFALGPLLAYFIRILLAHNLSAEEYGLFYSIMAFIFFFIVFRDFGLGVALTKFIPEYQTKKDFSKIKTFIIATLLFQAVFSAIVVILLLIFSRFLANNYFRTPISFQLLIVLNLFIFSTFLHSNIRNILIGFQDSKLHSIAEPLRLGLTLIFIFIFIKFGHGLLSAAYGFIFGSFTAFLILLIGGRKYFFIFTHKIKQFWKSSRQLFRFGIPMIFMGIGNTVIASLDILILTYVSSLTIVGIYNVILPTAAILLFFGKAVSVVLLPMISELKTRKDRKRIYEGLTLINRYIFLMTIPVIFVIWVLSEEIILILFGNNYVAGATALRILLLGVLFYTVAILNNAAISGLGKPKEVTKIIIISAIINIILNLILIPIFGMIGAATATSISYFFVLYFSTKKISRLVKVASPWTNWIKNVFAGFVFMLIMQIIIYLLELNILIEIVLGLSAGFLVYLFLVRVLGLFKIVEVKNLLKRII